MSSDTYPSWMTPEQRQAVYDEALAQGILEAPLTATAHDGIASAAIEEREGETVLVQTPVASERA